MKAYDLGKCLFVILTLDDPGLHLRSKPKV